ncbi:hypothetical protein PLICRDRAFT_170072 [Plicaturopsis crispa FD-325 SS-3]|nr:hypothetical protein PLICRDRAFT_170072 [Plicaturopsis crispa FD-325 SS-3]
MVELVRYVLRDYGLRHVRLLPNNYKHRSIGSAATTENENSDTEDEDAEGPSLKNDRVYASYRELIHYIPEVVTKILSEDITILQLTAFYKHTTAGARGARGDDIRRSKWIIISIIQKIHGPLNPTVDIHSRSGRGFPHPDCGFWICPAMYDWKNPVVQTKILQHDPEFPVTADLMPNLCWDEGKYDKLHIEHGFLQSMMLLLLWMALFLGPSSINNDALPQETASTRNARRRGQALPHGHRKCVAKLGHITSVTPRSIAYVAVMARFALSNVSAWGIFDGFDYEEFYCSIVDYFENPPDAAAKSRCAHKLSWWNKKIFGRPSAAVTPPHTHSSIAAMAAQREAEGEGAEASDED